jgi:hypothetical protein
MNPHDPSRIATLLRGRIQDVPFGELLHAFALRRRTLSFLLHETIGELLVNEGRISSFECKECVTLAVERGMRVGQVLLEMGLIRDDELHAALQRNLARRLLECFTWTEGEFRVLSGLPESEPTGRVNVTQLIFTGITRFAPESEVNRGFGALLGKDLVLQPSPSVALKDIRRSPHHDRLLRRLRRPTPAEELFRGAGMSKDELIRVVYALSVLGILAPAMPLSAGIAPRGAGKREREEPRPSSERAPAADEEIELELEIDLEESAGERDAPDTSEAVFAARTAGLSTTEAEVLRRTIALEYEKFRDRSPIDILGLPDGATARDARRRYVELCARYAPGRFEAQGLRSVAELASELLSLTVRAYMELKQGNAGEERGRSETPTAPDREKLARDYRRQAIERLESGNFSAASGLFELAVGCNPGDTACCVELAYTRFREDPANAEESLGRLLEAASRGQAGPQVYFYAAEISQSLGEVDDARERFLRGCELWSCGSSGSTDAA